MSESLPYALSGYSLFSSWIIVKIFSKPLLAFSAKERITAWQGKCQGQQTLHVKLLSGRSYREGFICSMSPGSTPLSLTVIEYPEMAPACLSPIRCFARKAFTWRIDQSDWTPEQAPNLTLRLSLNRTFSHDVTAAILVIQNNETAAMLGVLNKPCGS